MRLTDITGRKIPPEPWAEGDNIPWNDPAFSERMLREHLSSAHDMASRRAEKIAEHVEWIHRELLSDRPTRILDLACGPGLYTSRLARLGHQCVGIDFSPASVACAEDCAAREGLDCEYLQQDIREADYGSDFGLVMVIFGQLNVFRRGQAQDILKRARCALGEGGHILLEVHTFAAVQRQGKSGRSWYSAEAGLFSDRPYICLEENFWQADTQTSTTRFFVVDAATGNVTGHALSCEAYTDEQYHALLNSAGFRQTKVFPSLKGVEDTDQADFMVLVAEKR